MTGDISLSLDDFVYYPLFEITSGDIGLKAELKTEKSTGQFLSLNPPELIVGNCLNWKKIKTTKNILSMLVSIQINNKYAI